MDDLWFDLDKKQVVVADYKAQSSATPIEKESYLGSTYHQGYKIQMDIYVYILRQMGYSFLIRLILWYVMGKKLLIDLMQICNLW